MKVRPAIAAIFFGLAAIAVVVNILHVVQWESNVPEDLSYFIAGGRVAVVDRKNPYLEQPLLDRERRFGGPTRYGVAGPVPLPPYDLLAFGLIARLPLRLSLGIFGAALLLSGAIAAFVISRFSRFPLAVAVAGVFIGALYESTELGQIAPIAMAALALAVWGLRTGRPIATAIALAAGLIQPQIAAPAVLAALLFLPSVRPALLVSLGVIFALTSAILGPEIWVEFARTLPLQVRAELHFPPQMGMSWLLSALGATPAIALGCATAIAVVGLVAGLVLVGRARERAAQSGAILLLPVLFALSTASFIHSYQLEFALVPAALFVSARRRFSDFSWALAILVIPFGPFTSDANYWPTRAAWLTILFAFATSWAVMYCLTADLDVRFARLKSSLTVLVIAAYFAVLAKSRPILDFSGFSTIPGIHASDNAAIGWGLLSDRVGLIFGHVAFLIAAKLVLWVSVIMVTAATIRTLHTPLESDASDEPLPRSAVARA